MTKVVNARRASAINTAVRLFTGFLLAGVAAAAAQSPPAGPPRTSRFSVEEATIADVHRAIQHGQTTCRAIVESYVERARAYNGVCTQLMTRDGMPVQAAAGPVRAGSRVTFPTSTTPIASVLPKIEEYSGTPLDFGRMEPTMSDPTVLQQYGMVAGIPNAGQINALSTLNIRGERSVSCRAECDRAPSAGPLAASCPAACDAFRRQPDALERASELDSRYGRHPDLQAMPMYCVALSFKDVYDTKDMRTTGGADVSYAMDAPPQDATVVAALRAKGAIVYAKANLDEYNAGSGDPGGPARSTARGPETRRKRRGRPGDGVPDRPLALRRIWCTAPSARRPEDRADSRRGATTSSRS